MGFLCISFVTPEIYPFFFLFYVQEQANTSGKPLNTAAGTSNAGDFGGSNNYGMSALHNQVSYVLELS